MTIINGGSSNSSSGSSSTTNNVTTTSDKPGGKQVTLLWGDSYVVPANCVLHITRVGYEAPPTVYGKTNDQYYASSGYNQSMTVVVNGKPIATMAQTPPLTGTGVGVGIGQSMTLDVHYQAGESLTFDCYSYYSTSSQINFSTKGSYAAFAPLNPYLTGYLVQTTSGSNQSYAHSEPETATWWKPNVIVPYATFSSAPVRAVALGDGLALLIRNATIDKTSTVINIETGVETAVYTGTGSLSVGSMWFMHAAYDANYKGSGKSLLRVAMGQEAAADKGGCTDIMVSLQNTPTALDTDFKIVSLPTLLYGGMTSGRDGLSGRKILGFAGTDYIVTALITAANHISSYNTGSFNSMAALPSNGISIHNITTSPVTITNYLPGGLALPTDYGGGYNTTYYWYDSIARAKGVRGQNGRLYVHLHVGSDNAGALNSYRYQVAVIDNTGTALGGFTSPANGNLFVGTATTSTSAAQATIGVSTPLGTDPAGSEKLLAVTCAQLYNSGNTQTAHYQLGFTGAGVPSVNATYGNKYLGGSTYVQTAADFPSLPEAPTAARLGAYFDSFGLFSNYYDGNNYVLLMYKGAQQLQSVPSQERRTNGVIYGNNAGWYYPTGLFVEKRSFSDFGALVGSGAVQTVIANPVQAIASATKLLIVGINGQYEVVTP